MIGKLPGQNDVQSTARYGHHAHLSRASVRAASEQIWRSLAADMDSAPTVAELGEPGGRA